MTDEKMIEEAAKAMFGVGYAVGMPSWAQAPDDIRGVYLARSRAAFAVFEKAHAKELDTSTEPVKNDGDSLHVAPTDDEREEPEQTEFYEVMGGQGLMRIAKNLTKAEAEEVRDKFDRDCMRAGLFNPPTRINKQHGRY